MQEFNSVYTALSFSGKVQKLKPYSARRDVDFGRGIGKKPVYLLYVTPLFPTHVSTKKVPKSSLQVQI